MGGVTARLKPGLLKIIGLVAPQSAGDRGEHEVPPLRFASVGMTEFVCYGRGGAFFYLLYLLSSYFGWGDVVFDYSVEVDLAPL